MSEFDLLAEFLQSDEEEFGDFLDNQQSER